MDINHIVMMGTAMMGILDTIDDLIWISIFNLIEVYGIDENETMANLTGILEQITAMELDLA